MKNYTLIEMKNTTQRTAKREREWKKKQRSNNGKHCRKFTFITAAWRLSTAQSVVYTAPQTYNKVLWNIIRSLEIIWVIASLLKFEIKFLQKVYRSILFKKFPNFEWMKQRRQKNWRTKKEAKLLNHHQKTSENKLSEALKKNCKQQSDKLTYQLFFSLGTPKKKKKRSARLTLTKVESINWQKKAKCEYVILNVSTEITPHMTSFLSKKNIISFDGFFSSWHSIFSSLLFGCRYASFFFLRTDRFHLLNICLFSTFMQCEFVGMIAL